ncbi:MAG: hypothetical protein HMLKMBBP_03368 [Planctomycetes bacterium]|nr:hypothetical protein [Planctomycetota bacterium]
MKFLLLTAAAILGASAAFAARPADGTYSGGIGVFATAKPLAGGPPVVIEESYDVTAEIGEGTVQISGAFAPFIARINRRGVIRAPADPSDLENDGLTALQLAEFTPSFVQNVKVSGKASRRPESAIRITIKSRMKFFESQAGGDPPNYRGKVKIVFDGFPAV